MESTPFFFTHHAPCGAWASFLFGQAHRGFSLSHECLTHPIQGDLVVGAAPEKEPLLCLPFIRPEIPDPEGRLQPNPLLRHLQILEPNAVQRLLKPGSDTFHAGSFCWRIYTPHSAPPDPGSDASLKFACCPGLLLELAIDNSQGEQPVRGFVGFHLTSSSPLAPLDWAVRGDALCGIGQGENWCLAALPQPNRVMTRCLDPDQADVSDHREQWHGKGSYGGVLVWVPPGKVEVLALALTWFHHGPATHGQPGVYTHTREFKGLHDAARFILANASRIRDESTELDSWFQKNCADASLETATAQTLNTVAAYSQLLHLEDQPHWALLSGADGWRNALDTIHHSAPWDLLRAPWLLRNKLESHLRLQSLRTKVRFTDLLDGPRTGGLCFARDLGFGQVFTPPGKSASEAPLPDGPGYFTSENLLHFSQAFCAYALCGDDPNFLRHHTNTARDLLTSLEHRDHIDPAKRNGILIGTDERSGEHPEMSRAGWLDKSLKHASGQTALAVNTWGTLLMLRACLELMGLEDEKEKAQDFANRTSSTLTACFSRSRSLFPAHLYEPSEAAHLGILDGLALPIFCGLKEHLLVDTELIRQLTSHTLSCLKPGVCLDARGNLRLISNSKRIRLSDMMLTLYVTKELLGIDWRTEFPSLREFVRSLWFPRSAAPPGINTFDDSPAQPVGEIGHPALLAIILWVCPTLYIEVPDEPSEPDPDNLANPAASDLLN